MITQKGQSFVPEEFEGEFEDLVWRFTQADHSGIVKADFIENDKRRISLSAGFTPGEYTIKFNYGDGKLREILDKTFDHEEAKNIAEDYIINKALLHEKFDCDEMEVATFTKEKMDNFYNNIVNKLWWKFW